MSEQSERESFDKRIADLVAHRTPDEMARDLLKMQDAQKANEEQQQQAQQQEQPRQNDAAQATTQQDNPLADEGDVPAEPKTSKKHHR